jgi:hypothetical protein
MRNNRQIDSDGKISGCQGLGEAQWGVLNEYMVSFQGDKINLLFSLRGLWTLRAIFF